MGRAGEIKSIITAFPSTEVSNWPTFEYSPEVERSEYILGLSASGLSAFKTLPVQSYTRWRLRLLVPNFNEWPWGGVDFKEIVYTLGLLDQRNSF